MDTKVSLENAKKDFPDAVNAIMEKLHNGKSKSKDSNEGDLKWKFAEAVRVPCMNFKGVIERMAQSGNRQEKHHNDFESYWDEASANIFVYL